jgi:hypothetical protein
MKRLSIFLAALLVSGSGIPAKASDAYLLIAGSYQLSDPSYLDEAEANVKRVDLAAARCGFREPLWLSSDKIGNGMKPGHIVQVAGMFSDPDRAQMGKNLLRDCVKDAYVKRIIKPSWLVKK